jgi:hypothetical protein
MKNGGAPHKPILLLSVIRLFEKGIFADNYSFCFALTPRKNFMLRQRAKAGGSLSKRRRDFFEKQVRKGINYLTNLT